MADSRRAVRVLETAGAPVVYVPRDDVAEGVLQPAAGTTFCEWKGTASYFDVGAGGAAAERAAWAYPAPTPPFAEIAGWVSFYPALVDCLLGDEPRRAAARRLLRRLGDRRGLRSDQGRAGLGRLVDQPRGPGPVRYRS